MSSPAEVSKTKKRGRPPREAAVEAEVEEANEEEPEPAQAKPKSKKANKSDSKDSEEAADADGLTSRGEKAASRGKAGRKPRKEANEEAQDADEADTSNAAKKKRGRQPAKNTEEEPGEAVSPEPAPKKKRGRPSLDKKPATEEPSQAAEEDVVPKKRGRKPKEKAPEVEEPAPEEEVEAEAPPKKKRGRKANVTVEEVEEPPAEEEPAAIKKRRGRPAAQAESEAQEASQSEPKEGQRRKGKQPQPAEEITAEKPNKKLRKKGEEEEEASPDTQRRRPGRPRTSDAASTLDQTSQVRKSKKRTTEDDAAEASAPAKKRRRRTSDEIQKEEQQQKQQQQQQQPKPEAPKTVRRAPKHRHIAARVRQVPRSIIEEKWSPLTNPSLSIVSNLLRLAERPVLQRIPGSEKRRDQAASALHLITNRLVKKLSRGLPFPPASAPPTGGKNGSRKLLDTDSGRVDELNFERVIEGVATLERQLDPLLHAVDLLKTEKEREEKALEEDYDTLHTLEANARSEARNFKDSLRKTHVLLPEATKPSTASAAVAAETAVKHDEPDFNFIVSKEGVGNGTPLFKDLEDDELRGLAAQVGSHMESMRANLQQIDGVVPQIVKSRAALQDVLFKHLDQQSFENVLFG